MIFAFTKQIKHIAVQTPRWSRYLMGKSTLHPVLLAKENPSTCDSVRDYICDFSPKGYWIGKPDENGVPRNELNDGSLVYFSIGIIQKLLGNLELGKPQLESQALVKWICQSIDESNCIPTWQHATERTTSIYSAMAQGQALSALIRVEKEMPDKSVRLAIDRLCDGFISGERHGIILNSPAGAKLIETPDHRGSVILNGWIYALWGLREAAITTQRPDIKELADNSTEALASCLSDFYDGAWSYYDDKGRIASPFYHQLHITQLSALFEMTKVNVFGEVSKILNYQYHSRLLRTRSVLRKGYQKLKEKPYREFIG